MDFYTCTKVNEQVTKITDLAGVAAYLVEGRDKAALLDTCSGAGDLRALVSTLTQKPLQVILTHGHVDHAGGAYGFDTVYLSDKDYDLAKDHTRVEMRKGYIDMMTPPDTVKLEDYVPARDGGYLNLVDGQLFDLGGLTLEAIAVPGHSQGMTCILLREQRTLLLGDACNTATFLFAAEATSVEEYKVSLINLLCHQGKFDVVLFSHGHNQGTKTIVDECIELCDEIMARTTDDVPFKFMGQDALIAKAANPDFSRVDGKQPNIIYNPNRIFRLG